MKPSLEMHEIAPEHVGGDASMVKLADLGLFTALFRSLPGRAVLVDVGGIYRFANQEFFDFLGLTEAEVIGRHVGEILGEEIFAAYEPMMARLAAGESIRWEGWADYGRFGRRFVQEAITPFRPEPQGPVHGFFAVARDLTDLKAREQELVSRIAAQEAEEAYHAAVVGTALDGIVIMDDQGLVVDFNPAAEAIFGYTKTEALGRPVADLIIPEEFRTAHTEGMRAYLETGLSRVLGKRLELPAVLADGTRIPIELAITDVTRGGRRLFAAHMRDLSAAKRAEEEIKRQRNALHQKEKLAALGSLLAGVAHELNNPLSIVTGQTMMLREQVAKEGAHLPFAEKLLSRCDRIATAANRCARIVRSFLAMARQKEAERKATKLVDVVNEAVDLLSYNMRAAGVRVECELDSSLPPLMLDAGQIHQVLLNLLVNAQQALEETVTSERRIAIHLGLDASGDAVLLKVEDNGPGIPDQIRSRVFDPFFTTKPQGAGTGIGLAVSRGLIEAHGGTLELIDAPSGGACFQVHLPLLPADERAETETEGSVPAKTGRPTYQHVLIIDDEPEIAALLAEITEDLGHIPAVAHSAAEARGLVLAQASGFAAILCDIRMPDGDGPAFYDWLLVHRPELATRIGFITGDTLGPAAGRFLARSGCPLIEKPFSPADIRGFLADLCKPADAAAAPRAAK